MYVGVNGNPKSGKFLSGVASTTDSRDTYLVRQMHRVATLIYAAKQRNDVAEVQRLWVEFKGYSDEYRERGPIGVNAFDKFVLSTGEWIEASLAAVPGAIAAPFQAVGSGLIRGLAPFALIALAFGFVRKKL